MQTWEDGHHPLPEGPGGLHAQKAGGCHQKGWQHPQVLVPMFYLLFFNSNCSINVKINMWVNFYFAGCISGLTTKEYIDLTFLLLFIILVPIILTLCCMGIKRSEIWDKCKESKAQKIYNRTRKISKNFSENKRMMKEMRQK